MSNPFRFLLLTFVLVACQEDPVLNQQQSDLSQNRPAASSSTNPDTPAANPAQTLSGIVRDQQTGKLIAGASIRLDTLLGSSDQVGFYQFKQPPAGASKLIVVHPDYESFVETITVQGNRQIYDIQMVPKGMGQNPLSLPSVMASSSPGLEPSASATPIMLLPSGVPTPTSASSSPTPTTVSSPTPTPQATPSSAYDPILDEAAQGEVLVKRHSKGLELVFSLQQANGLPVNWSWGSVGVEYYLADLSGRILANGKSVILSNGESFVVTSSESFSEQVQVSITFTLPDARTLSFQSTLTVGS